MTSEGAPRTSASDQRDVVVRQYERWPFPSPASRIDSSRRQAVDPGLASDIYWPAGRPPERLSILVAGCGTNQAAEIALHNVADRVVGLDASALALEHEASLAKKYNLENLTLVHGPIESVGELFKERFHLIIATGVIHHLANPVDGLRNLGRLLQDDGAMTVSLYGRYGRVGVDQIRHATQVLRLSTTQQEVDLLREILRALNRSHTVWNFLEDYSGVLDDTDIVDIFLNVRERGYTVPEVLRLVSDAGLVFQSWVHGWLYHPEGRWGQSTETGQRLDCLPLPAKWDVMECLTANMSSHTFVTCRRERPSALYNVESMFLQPEWSQMVPVLRYGHLSNEIGSPNSAAEGILLHPYGPRIVLSHAEALLYRAVDGSRTVSECLARLDKTEQVSGASVHRFFRSLWRAGFVNMRIRA